MRAIWKGAVSFGLVNVPVRLYSATENHDVQFRQVHREDGGRIKYQRICSIDGEIVSYDDIAKGYETEDGDMVVLTDEDFKDLPATSIQGDRGREVRPRRADRPDAARQVLLPRARQGRRPSRTSCCATRSRRRTGWRSCTVSIRTRMTMAVLRVHDGVIVMQTMLWPDEIRARRLRHARRRRHATKQELAMANMLIEQLAGDYEPERVRGRLRRRGEALVQGQGRGRRGAGQRPESKDESGEVVDLLAALTKSVEKAKAARGEAPAEETAAATKSAPKKATAKKAAAKKTTTKKAAAKKTAAKAS